MFKSQFLLAVASLWKREIQRFFRQRGRVIGALATPLMFWFFIGGGLRNSFSSLEEPLGNYFTYFFPGSILLSVLFTAIFSTISVIEDRNQGFLQGVLVSSVPRSAVVISKLMGGATLGLIQGSIILAFAPLAGVLLGLSQILFILALLFVVGFCLTGLGFYFAWTLDSVQGYHSIMNTVMIPLWLLSGAVFPLSGAHFILRWVGALNPLSLSVRLLRQIFSFQVDSHFAIFTFVVFGLFSLVFVIGNTRLVSKSSF